MFEKYRLCRDFRVLPRAGGMNEQNHFEMLVFQAMRDGEREANAELNRRATQGANPMGALIATLARRNDG